MTSIEPRPILGAVLVFMEGILANRTVLTAILSLLLAGSGFAFADEETQKETASEVVADAAPENPQDRLRKQAGKALSEKVDTRMMRISLGSLNGEAKAARFSIRNEHAGLMVQGGLTFECADSLERLEQGMFAVRTPEELEAQCRWLLWDYTLTEPEAEAAAPRAAKPDDEIAGFLKSSGMDAETDDMALGALLGPKDSIDANAMIRPREYSFATCPSMMTVMTWLEGFKPTPVDIERFGEDKQFEQVTDFSTYYRTTVFSRVKGGDLTFTYNGYSGEPMDMAVFLNAALDQCDLEASLAPNSEE